MGVGRAQTAQHVLEGYGGSAFGQGRVPRRAAFRGGFCWRASQPTSRPRDPKGQNPSAPGTPGARHPAGPCGPTAAERAAVRLPVVDTPNHGASGHEREHALRLRADDVQGVQVQPRPSQVADRVQQGSVWELMDSQ